MYILEGLGLLIMICNIVDHRSNDKKFRKVWGVLEPTENDNACKGADIILYSSNREWFTETSGLMSLSKLLTWANKFSGQNTLYIYDENDWDSNV